MPRHYTNNPKISGCLIKLTCAGNGVYLLIGGILGKRGSSISTLEIIRGIAIIVAEKAWGSEVKCRAKYQPRKERIFTKKEALRWGHEKSQVMRKTEKNNAFWTFYKNTTKQNFFLNRHRET